MPDPRKLSAQQKAALLRRQRRQAQELIASYRQVWQTLKSDLDRLGVQIKEAKAAGEAVNRGWLVKQHRLEGLLGQVEGEMYLTTSFLEREITTAQADAVLAGRINAEQLIAASLPPGLDWRPAFPTGAFRKLVGYAQDGQPLGDLLAELGPLAAQDVKRALVTGIALGKNPRVIARGARDALGGNMARALTIARTEVLRSYRESTRETYHANRDVVEGWQWSAALDNRTCSVCWGMHGEHFDTDEMMDTHPNCRCALVPTSKPWADLGFPDVAETRVELEPGADVFARQSESVQRQVLGPGKYEAYRTGKIQLSDLVQKTSSRRWGAGRREASLKTALANR